MKINDNLDMLQVAPDVSPEVGDGVAGNFEIVKVALPRFYYYYYYYYGFLWISMDFYGFSQIFTN